MANGDEAYVLAGKEDLGSDLEHTSDTSEPEIMSEPEIINESNGENGAESSDSRSGVLLPPVTDLPSTVTFLEGPSGSQVYVVGTAHFSEQSNEDVINTLEKIRPHILCLELCKNRLHVIRCTEEEILEEVQNIGIKKIRELISRSGVFYGLFQLAFLHQSAKLTQKLGMAPGGEFRAAYRKGRELGCTFRLSDRSIQITLQRAIYSLSLWTSICLAVKLIFNNEDISKEDVEKFKGDILQKLIDEISEEYPKLSRIFVDERDQFLSGRIFEAASENGKQKHTDKGEDSESSEELLEEKTRVVAVVGIGHIAGIKKYWGKTINCEEICRIPEPSITVKIVGKSIKYSVLSALLYGVYKFGAFGLSVMSPYLPLPDFTQYTDPIVETVYSYLA